LRGDFAGAPPIVGPAWWSLVGVAVGKKLLHGNRKWIWQWLPMTGSAIGLILVHTLIRWYPRPWYFVVSAQALAVGLGAGTAHMLQIEAPLSWARRGLSLVVAVLTGASLFSWLYVWDIGLYPWQDRMLEAAGWISDNTPRDKIVGSLNAGIYAYYSDRTVVNLDGVVNVAAYSALRERRLFEYMQAAGVHHFVDFDYALSGEYGVFMGPGYPDGLVPVDQAASDPYPGLGVIRAYRVLAP